LAAGLHPNTLKDLSTPLVALAIAGEGGNKGRGKEGERAGSGRREGRKEKGHLRIHKSFQK